MTPIVVSPEDAANLLAVEAPIVPQQFEGAKPWRDNVRLHRRPIISDTVVPARLATRTPTISPGLSPTIGRSVNAKPRNALQGQSQPSVGRYAQQQRHLLPRIARINGSSTA